MPNSKSRVNKYVATKIRFNGFFELNQMVFRTPQITLISSAQAQEWAAAAGNAADARTGTAGGAGAAGSGAVGRATSAAVAGAGAQLVAGAATGGLGGQRQKEHIGRQAAAVGGSRPKEGATGNELVC